MAQPLTLPPLSDTQVTELRQLYDTTTKAKLRLRAHIILLAHQGRSVAEIAAIVLRRPRYRRACAQALSPRGDRGPSPSMRDALLGVQRVKTEGLRAFCKVVGCILCNELIDNFPVHRFAIQSGRIKEVFVTSAGGTLTEVLDEPSSPRIEERLTSLGLFPATASAEGRQLNGAPFPATAWAEGRQLNGAPSLAEPFAGNHFARLITVDV